jgi:hypothetical protein
MPNLTMLKSWSSQEKPFELMKMAISPTLMKMILTIKTKLIQTQRR